MTFATFTATIALEDDDGNVYNADSVLSDVEHIVRTITPDPDEARLFTIATGEGIDTDTHEATREPVVVVQGFVPSCRALALMQALASYAGSDLNQRAIGWFVTTAETYVPTPQS